MVTEMSTKGDIPQLLTNHQALEVHPPPKNERSPAILYALRQRTCWAYLGMSKTGMPPSWRVYHVPYSSGNQVQASWPTWNSVNPFRRTGFPVHHNNPRQCHRINRHSNRLTSHCWYTYSIHVVFFFWLSKYIYMFYTYNDQVLGLHQRGQFQWTEHLILVGL